MNIDLDLLLFALDSYCALYEDKDVGYKILS